DDPGAGGVTEEVVAFLPSLDSSTMGWKERSWYLGPHGGEVFDSIGNAGPTIWVGGRIVGGWGQKPDGTVVYEILEDVPERTASSIADEAQALGAWLGERVVMPRFPSPLGRRLAQQERRMRPPTGGRGKVPQPEMWAPEQLREAGSVPQAEVGGRYRSRSAAEAGVGGAPCHDLWRASSGERLGETDDDPVRSADEAEPVLIL